METITNEYGLNLHHLELFHIVVQEGGVTRAAERMGVSQPAVSKQIRELEDRAGMALLERLPRGIRPTEAGEALDAHAVELFAVRDRASQALRDRLDRKAGRLSVGASRTIGTYLLPGLLARFRGANAGVEIRVEIGNTAQVETLLREGRIELGLVEGETVEGLPHGRFGVDELVPVASPGLLGGGRPPKTIAGFCRHPVVLREVGSGSRNLVERVFARAGIQVRPLASLDSTEAVREFVLAGLGVSFLPRIAVASHLADGTLLEVGLSDAVLRRTFRWILWPGRPASPAVEAFLAVLGTGATAESRRR